ncbi:MAG TPA: M3 family oligoendopeptidase [Flavobacteriales bacterium]|nr:M3 family oligoendopeptidase [Flavobacteriales bacterium]
MSTLKPASRTFVAEGADLGDPVVVAGCFHQLDERAIADTNALEQWLKDLSELDAALSEEGAWRYIRMTLDTCNEQAATRYQRFVNDVMPMVEERTDKLHRKLMALPFVDRLAGEGYAVYFRGIREQLRIFREANVPLQAELRNLAQEYSTTIGAMSVEWKGETITLPKAAALLEGTDRTEREAAFKAIAQRRLQDADKLNTLFDAMVAKRNTIAANAGFTDFRDHTYSSLGRFDHTPADAIAFHESVEREVVPIVERLERERMQSLGLKKLRPWDLQVDPSGLPPLKPFNSDEQLIDLAENVFGKLDPYFSECIRTMRTNGRLDLGSRNGKAPGGYNYPLYETGAPFIFMNAVGTTDDVVTMFHEGGHAVHSFLTHPLPITGFKGFPSEVAELASMGMELLTMDHWHLVYPDPADLKRAKRDQMERVLSILPWVATVDSFQHAVYTHPQWSMEERTQAWVGAHSRFAGSVVDWSGLEKERAALWHKQLHIFELPFYYIEYAIAQLGAIGVWRNYKQDPKAAVEAYTNALKLGYTRTLPEIYAAAGVRFDFSRKHIAELASFVNGELDKL